GDVRARFYRGLALLQRGEQQDALDVWVGLIEGAPADAPWLPDLRQRAAALAGELGLDPEQVLPPERPVGTAQAEDGASAPRGPTAEEMQAAEAMSPEEREEMIRGMVEGLAARLEQQPDDVEGWRMLGRSFAALGEQAKSAEAYGQVAWRLPDDVTAQVDYASALLAQESVDQPPSAEAIAQLQRVLALDHDNPIALFHLGRAAAARGDTAGAAEHWRRLLARMPADAPVRSDLERMIENLQADGPTFPRAAGSNRRAACRGAAGSGLRAFHLVAQEFRIGRDRALHAAQLVARVIRQPPARDVLTHRPEAFIERGRSAGIRIDVIGGDSLAHDRLRHQADHQGKQSDHRRLRQSSVVHRPGEPSHARSGSLVTRVTAGGSCASACDISRLSRILAGSDPAPGPLRDRSHRRIGRASL